MLVQRSVPQAYPPPQAYPVSQAYTPFPTSSPSPDYQNYSYPQYNYPPMHYQPSNYPPVQQAPHSPMCSQPQPEGQVVLRPICCAEQHHVHFPGGLATSDPDCSAWLFKWCCASRASRSLWWCPSYIADWLVLTALGVGEIIMIVLWKPTIRPYQPAILISNGTYSYNDNTFQFPHKEDTITPVVNVIISIIVPWCIAILYHVVCRFGPSKDKSLHDLHHFTLGLCTSLVAAEFLWIPLIVSVGALRPDFWWRLNNGDEKEIDSGRQSFVSGHAMCSFLGLGFFTFWLCGKLRVYHSSRGNLWRFFICAILPMALAAAQTITRVTDFRHHPVDVLGGSIIGISAAVIGYHLNYPPNFAPDCHLPKNRRLAYPVYLLSGIPHAPTKPAADA